MGRKADELSSSILLRSRSSNYLQLTGTFVERRTKEEQRRTKEEQNPTSIFR